MQYTYDAENRMMSATPLNPQDGDQKVESAYDYMSRRISKQVSIYQSGSWIVDNTIAFVYDGWNVIKEETTTGLGTTTEYDVWGLDLSGSFQGAGGIGGLLLRNTDTGTFLYLYDANGNVGQLVNSSTGEIAAQYEYGAYGKFLRADGSEADNNPFRFSTKYFDVEIGLYYYGYRYYSPELGRWMTRDPIEEEGGFNLYGIVENNPTNFIDPLGQTILSLEVRGTGESWIEKNVFSGIWKQSLERVYQEAGAGAKLGLHVGKGYDPVRLFSQYRPRSVGLWKFEAKAIWCRDSDEPPIWSSYARNVWFFQIDLHKKKNTKVLEERIPEFPDGPSYQLTEKFKYIDYTEELTNPDGTFTTYAWDAPRIAVPFKEKRRYRYYVTGDWRIQVSHNNSLWETEIRLRFFVDDDADPGTSRGYFEITSPPRQIK